MAMITFRCSCGETLHADARQIGRQCQCGQCGRLIDILPLPAEQLYASFDDQALLELAAERDTFAPETQRALDAEIARRHLSSVPYLTRDEHKQPRRSLLHWLLWWRIDQEELDKQIVEYASLKITQSAKGQSFFLLIFSALITTISIAFSNYSSASFIDVFILSLLGCFIYRGQQWAMIGAMIFWTLEKFYILYTGIQAPDSSDL